MSFIYKYFFPEQKTDLKDYSVKIPKYIATPTSNMIFAMCGQNFYPCLILRKASTIKDGYAVYFFHTGEETEIPSNNVIGNVKMLIQREVSFMLNGVTTTGTVEALEDSKESNGPMSFFIKLPIPQGCLWVSLPFVFITGEQASVFTV